MAAKVCSTGRRALPRSDVAKKKPQTGQDVAQFSHQMNIRVPGDLYERIEATAAAYSLDLTNFVRMVIKQSLPRYEKEAEQFRGNTPHE